MMHLMALTPSQGSRQIHLLIPLLQQVRSIAQLTPAQWPIRLYNFIIITSLTPQATLITVMVIPTALTRQDRHSLQ